MAAKYHCKILTAGNQAESNKSNLASNDCSKNMSTVLTLPSTIHSSLHRNISSPSFSTNVESTSCIVLDNPPQLEIKQHYQKKHSHSESITNQHKTITLEQENCISNSKLKSLNKTDISSNSPLESTSSYIAPPSTIISSLTCHKNKSSPCIFSSNTVEPSNNITLDSPPQQDFERDSGSKASENVVSQCKEIRTEQENNNIVNTGKSQNKISADVPEVQSLVCSDCGKSFKSSLYKHAGNSHKISIKKSGPIKCWRKDVHLHVQELMYHSSTWQTPTASIFTKKQRNFTL